jgi:hypothetical protein
MNQASESRGYVSEIVGDVESRLTQAESGDDSIDIINTVVEETVMHLTCEGGKNVTCIAGMVDDMCSKGMPEGSPTEHIGRYTDTSETNSEALIRSIIHLYLQKEVLDIITAEKSKNGVKQVPAYGGER